MLRRLFYLLSGFVLLTGCIDVVETDIIEIEEKVYISSFISPENDSLTVNISRTLPALGLEFDLNVPDDNIMQFLIRDADVRVFDSSGNSVFLPFQENNLKYSQSANEFPILPGETYELEVLIDGRVYTASCTIPMGNVEAIQEEINIMDNEFGGREYTLNFGFNDILNGDNFYYLGAFLNIDDEFDPRRELFFDLEAYQTDVLGDGTPLSASSNFFPVFDFDVENDSVFLVEQELVLQVINAEESLYQLLRNRYLNDLNEFNPFIELAIEPNNINGNGGTGLFAGYRYFEKRIPLAE
ncbi:Hypothetical protein I595_2017 [Croceitalea dokdonensis DOKDO 023]|uniref:DUF4249 domain-containing protein n=1 Tax=Croceitalea dokdonensis DOKDO 023 TaxID=1300341 RepID=A0A0P7AID7_9FLAO|nr:DUF4249 family protein [Croceitalea dokdonensis]KPM31530.1 Hypothetical protein I595_2017 [Croceitalea dokdonensis DOKDO 023]